MARYGPCSCRPASIAAGAQSVGTHMGACACACMHVYTHSCTRTARCTRSCMRAPHTHTPVHTRAYLTNAPVHMPHGTHAPHARTERMHASHSRVHACAHAHARMHACTVGVCARLRGSRHYRPSTTRSGCTRLCTCPRNRRRACPRACIARTHARTHACIYRYQLPAQAGVPSARWATEPPAFVPCEMHTALAELVASAEELDGKTR